MAALGINWKRYVEYELVIIKTLVSQKHQQILTELILCRLSIEKKFAFCFFLRKYANMGLSSSLSLSLNRFYNIYKRLSDPQVPKHSRTHFKLVASQLKDITLLHPNAGQLINVLYSVHTYCFLPALPLMSLKLLNLRDIIVPIFWEKWCYGISQ